MMSIKSYNKKAWTLFLRTCLFQIILNLQIRCKMSFVNSNKRLNEKWNRKEKKTAKLVPIGEKSRMQ